MGWSSWSSLRLKVSEDVIKAQADVLAAKLAPYGFNYVNIDDGWFHGCDDHGRLKPDPQKFPSGMPALAAYLHGKGLKLGIYLTPGLLKEGCDASGTVAGSAIHLRDIIDTTRPGNCKRNAHLIDYTRPGAAEHVQGYANLLASWGVDYIKMDFVGPNTSHPGVDNRGDIEHWASAIQKTGRPMWLELSNGLSFELATFWKAHSNGWRIQGDVEFYKGPGVLTEWSKILPRFADAPRWAPYAGPGGWNDLDSVEIGNGDIDGLTVDERRSTMTLWAISSSPLLIGANLTQLDAADLLLLTNAEVIAVDQSGHVATPLGQQSKQQVWRAQNPDGSFTVAFFNLGDEPGEVSVKWSELGVPGPLSVRDLWEHKDLGRLEGGYGVVLARHASQLLRLSP
jgi:hypothetical protein